MTLAIWDHPMAERAVSGLGTGLRAPTLHRLRPEACAAALLEERVDVALVPTTMVLQGAEGFEVVPGAALSSWKYPFARIVLKQGLRGEATRLAYDQRNVQEQFAAATVLREHYDLEPAPVAYDDAPPVKALLQGEENAALVTSTDLDALPDLGRLGGGGLVMDLGREWYELAKYPMVWGLFVAREDTLDAKTTKALRDGLHAAEEHRPEWVEEADRDALEEFFGEDLRLRFDDLVTAGLTELKRYLFYYDVLTDIPDLSFAPLPEDDGEGEMEGEIERE